MLLFLVATKLVAEIALMALLGRWVLAAWVQRLSPAGGQGNVFLWVLDTLCLPFVRAAGWITPRRVSRQLHSLVAFLLLLLVWAVVTVAKIGWCLDVGVAVCR